MIKFVNLAISQYAPIEEDPEVYAALAYDEKTAEMDTEVRMKLIKEFKELQNEGKT